MQVDFTEDQLKVLQVIMDHRLRELEVWTPRLRLRLTKARRKVLSDTLHEMKAKIDALCPVDNSRRKIIMQNQQRRVG